MIVSTNAVIIVDPIEAISNGSNTTDGMARTKLKTLLVARSPCLNRTTRLPINNAKINAVTKEIIEIIKVIINSPQNVENLINFMKSINTTLVFGKLSLPTIHAHVSQKIKETVVIQKIFCKLFFKRELSSDCIKTYLSIVGATFNFSLTNPIFHKLFGI